MKTACTKMSRLGESFKCFTERRSNHLLHCVKVIVKRQSRLKNLLLLFRTPKSRRSIDFCIQSTWHSPPRLPWRLWTLLCFTGLIEFARFFEFARVFRRWNPLECFSVRTNDHGHLPTVRKSWNYQRNAFYLLFYFEILTFCWALNWI